MNSIRKLPRLEVRVTAYSTAPQLLDGRVKQLIREFFDAPHVQQRRYQQFPNRANDELVRRKLTRMFASCGVPLSIVDLQYVEENLVDLHVGPLGYRGPRIDPDEAMPHYASGGVIPKKYVPFPTTPVVGRSKPVEHDEKSNYPPVPVFEEPMEEHSDVGLGQARQGIHDSFRDILNTLEEKKLNTTKYPPIPRFRD